MGALLSSLERNLKETQAAKLGRCRMNSPVNPEATKDLRGLIVYKNVCRKFLLLSGEPGMPLPQHSPPHALPLFREQSMGKLRHRAELSPDTLRCPWSKPGHSYSKDLYHCSISSPCKDLWAPTCSQNRWDQEVAPAWEQAWLSLEQTAGTFRLPEAIWHW